MYEKKPMKFIFKFQVKPADQLLPNYTEIRFIL